MRLKSLPVISTGMYTSIIVFSIVFHLSMAFTLNMSNASREKQMEILDIVRDVTPKISRHHMRNFSYFPHSRSSSEVYQNFSTMLSTAG